MVTASREGVPAPSPMSIRPVPTLTVFLPVSLPPPFSWSQWQRAAGLFPSPSGGLRWWRWLATAEAMDAAVQQVCAAVLGAGRR